MSPADHCDDTRPYVVAYFNNQLQVIGAWTWDGVSTSPNCNGVINSLRVVNTSAVDTYRALLPNARRGPVDANGEHYVDIPPNTDRTITGATLRAAGLDTIQDLAAVDLVKQ